MPELDLPEWERLLAAAAHLQRIVPQAILVGGTASALFARHRQSHDADHVVPDLRARFDEILAQLESVAGWRTARVKRPVMILGNLDGIETGVRQLIRREPLATTQVDVGGQRLTIPTEAEMLRIKAALILQRNATRDYLDFVALAEHMGLDNAHEALADLDRLYPQPSGESALQQLQVQLAAPMPYDLQETDLAEYRRLHPRWHDWSRIRQTCAAIAAGLLDRLP